MYSNLVALQTELLNAAVAQKDSLIEAINTSNLAGLQEITRQITLVSGVWTIVNYGYKIPELERLIVVRQEFLTYGE